MRFIEAEQCCIADGCLDQAMNERSGVDRLDVQRWEQVYFFTFQERKAECPATDRKHWNRLSAKDFTSAISCLLKPARALFDVKQGSQ